MRRIGQEILIQGIVDVTFVTIMLDYVIDLLKSTGFFTGLNPLCCVGTRATGKEKAGIVPDKWSNLNIS